MWVVIKICDGVANGLLALCFLTAVIVILHVGEVSVRPITMLWLTAGSLALSAMFHGLSMRLRAWYDRRRQQ